MIQRLNKHFKIQLKKKGQIVFLSFLNKTFQLKQIKIKISLYNKSLNLNFKNNKNNKLLNKTKTI